MFVVVLTLCNSAFLAKYYEFEKKNELTAAAELLEDIDLYDQKETADLLGKIDESYGFDVEIYTPGGRVLYSTSRGAMLDYIFKGNEQFKMDHIPLRIIKSEKAQNGGRIEKAMDRLDGTEYLLYRFSLKEDATVEIRTQMSHIVNSAKIANRFIIIIASAVLLLALIWVFWFSRSISRPISKMSEITRKMAELDFSEKLSISSGDEIGRLAASVNTLSGKLDETLEDLRVTNSRLRDEIELERSLDKMRRGFVADVSHELKTPISIIQGYAEGLKLQINADSKDKYCDIIMDESRRMNKLVLSLLDLSKYESGGIPLNKTAFDIGELAKGLTRRITKDKELNVEFSIAENSIALADPDRIEQALKSYLENALSHTEKGGTISVCVSENKPGLLTVSVHNTGSSIPKEEMPRIWESFYRGDKAHNRNGNRFGLGLSIVSAIIKLHGRECGVYNTDSGVCFWFTVDKNK